MRRSRLGAWNYSITLRGDRRKLRLSIFEEQAQHVEAKGQAGAGDANQLLARVGGRSRPVDASPSPPPSRANRAVFLIPRTAAHTSSEWQWRD